MYIPFAKDSSEFVSAILEAWIADGDTTFNTIYHWQYINYTDSTTRPGAWDKKDFLNVFLHFQYRAFAHKKFRVNDKRIFKVNADSSLVLTRTSVNGTHTAREDYFVYEECVTMSVCQIVGFVRSSSQHCYDSYSIEVCTTYYFEMGGGGPIGNGEFPPGGGGGWSSPCRPDPQFGTNPCNNPPAWEPIEEVDTEFASVTSVDYSSISDPCLIVLLAAIGQSGHQSAILRTYDQQQYTPATQDRYKVKYLKTPGLTNAIGQAIPATTTQNVLPDGTNEITINLNTDLFVSTSKEWVTSVILHELLHGILLVRRPDLTTGAQQHMHMFNNRFPIAIHESLQEIFPGMNYYHFLALGMGGMSEGYMIPDPNNPGSEMIDPIKDAFALQAYSQNIIQAIDRQNLYMQGALGAPYC